MTRYNADMTDWIALSPDSLDAAAAVAFVTDPAAGGIDVFLGTTRAETHPKHGELVALDYEAYAEMALPQTRKLVADCRAKWPVIKAVVLHRTGVVKVGEASVIIAVSTPHRAASFEACRFLIDELKRFVTIWKKEVWAGGETSWVAGTLPEAAGGPRVGGDATAD